MNFDHCCLTSVMANVVLKLMLIMAFTKYVDITAFVFNFGPASLYWATNIGRDVGGLAWSTPGRKYLRLRPRHAISCARGIRISLLSSHFSVDSGSQAIPSDFLAERHIVLLCHNVSEDVGKGLFRPNNLLEGRVDVMCRCITNAIYFSNGVRRCCIHLIETDV